MGSRHSSPWSCLLASTPPGSRLHSGHGKFASLNLDAARGHHDAAQPSVIHPWVGGKHDLLMAEVSQEYPLALASRPQKRYLPARP